MGKSMAIVGVVFTLAAAPAHAAPLDDNAWKELKVRLAASATDARGDRPEDALEAADRAAATIRIVTQRAEAVA